MSKRVIVWTYSVAGYDAADKLLWGPVPVDAPNSDVARMYATAALKRLPEGEGLLKRTTEISSEPTVTPRK